MEIMEVLRSHPLLSQLPDADLLKLRNRSVTRRWRKGQVIFRKGDPCGGLYGIVSGSIVTAIEADNGKRQALGAYGPGTYVGALAALDGGAHHVTALAREASCTLFLTLGEYNSALARIPDSADRVIRLLCTELRNNLRYLESYVFLDVPVRLARLMLYLQPHHAGPGEKLPPIGFSQQEIADLLGCSREWVSRELGRWRDAGIIDIGRRHLVIRDKVALSRIVGAAGGSDRPGVTRLPGLDRNAPNTTAL
jgi:CRP/FNR family cyclic AMP-dependent transcriptional regulator